MHVHWLCMSPGPYFRPLILSFPLPGAGAYGNRRKLGPKDSLGLWPQCCFLLERKAQLGPCDFSFLESPVLTSTAPISGLHHPHTLTLFSGLPRMCYRGLRLHICKLITAFSPETSAPVAWRSLGIHCTISFLYVQVVTKSCG